MIGANDVKAEVERALAAVVAAGADLGITLPERRLAGSGGTPVFDCEMVAVYATALTLGSTGAPDEFGVATSYVPCSPILGVSLSAYIVRCAREKMGGPRGNRAPTPDEISEDLADASADVAVLHNAASSLAGFDVGSVGELTASYGFLAVEGGLRGVVAEWRYNLNWVLP